MQLILIVTNTIFIIVENLLNPTFPTFWGFVLLLFYFLGFVLLILLLGFFLLLSYFSPFFPTFPTFLGFNFHTHSNF